MPAARRKQSIVATYMTRAPEPGERRGPELPDNVLPGNADWHPLVRDWWEMVRTSPQSAAFMESDWFSLVDLALLKNVYWAKAGWAYAAEIRMREAKFGLTVKDRFDLRMEQDPRSTAREAALDDKNKRGNVTSITERRARAAMED